MRKAEPESLKTILDLFTAKRNNYLAGEKLGEVVEKNMERKLNFLNLELQDIKNNKGSVTL